MTLTLRCEPTADRSWAVLSVRDEGLRIPAADLERVFEPFQRASNVGPISGMGLGLANARQIVQEHGGRISVDSHEGAGSAFTVCLPWPPIPRGSVWRERSGTTPDARLTKATWPNVGAIPPTRDPDVPRGALASLADCAREERYAS